jgi:ferredoxin
MNAIEDDYTVNNTVECIECAECVAVCPPGAVSYTFALNRGDNKIDLSRRRFVQAAAAGISGLAVIRATASSRNQTGWMIRPPGSVPEEDFLDRCIRCQECTRICASTGNCLQPALLEGGLEKLWTPVSVPRLGYCDFECNLCGQVCPTGAIQELSLEEKQEIKMGTARFDKNRCIPWYSFNDCLVCEEHCPVSEKAIQFDIREVDVPEGGTRVVKFPYVVEDRCIGCGICENKCPLVGKPGIFVNTANEVRIEPGS